MAIEHLPDSIKNNYTIHEWKHASAILENDFPNEWRNIIEVLSGFTLKKDSVLASGGNKSTISDFIDGYFTELGWVEKKFDTKVVVDEIESLSPTHKVDCFKNRIAVEIEWNNKDPFYDRDLNNFRLLFDLRVISVGVIITRCDELQQIFKKLNIGGSYGNSTTHMSKLLPRIEGGSGGGCPILIFGISPNLFDDKVLLKEVFGTEKPFPFEVK